MANLKKILLIQLLIKMLPKFIKNIFILNKDIFVTLENPKHLLPIIRILYLHTNFQFKGLLDIIAIDYPQRLKYRFELHYCLISYRYNFRIFIQTKIKPLNLKILFKNTFDTQSIDSLTLVFNSANWLEREIWDCFGIFFINHSDLRRILTDYGFDSFPFRKDFPLTGYYEISYNEELKRIITEPVTLEQEFRIFDFVSPWKI